MSDGGKAIRIIATLTLWLAPLPAAFFVGRSVYYHLIYTWHLELNGWGIAAAIVSGGMVELVGLLSAHVALATGRWNRRGDVRRKDGHKEQAPVALAVGCFVVYCLSAFSLAVVLEAWPILAVWAPALFTIMAAAAYLAIGVYEQHRDRLRRYRLEWDWTAAAEQEERQAEQRPDVRPDVPDVPNNTAYRWECPVPGCGFVANNRHERAGHGNAHRTKGE